MDLSTHGQDHDNGREQNEIHQSANQFPLPTISTLSLPSNSSRSSLDSQNSTGIASHVHPPTPDMDGTLDAHRRRKGLLAGESENNIGNGKAHKKQSSRRQREGSRSVVESKHPANPSDEEHSSDVSSRSTSEDVELHHMVSEDELTDDEETGLTKKDRRKRKRRRRKNTLLDQRVMGSSKTSKQNAKLADISVLRASFINALLIASWYFFSLSISIVSQNALCTTFPLSITDGMSLCLVQQVDVLV